MTPETVDVPVPYDATVRRGLMVIAKIIQNLANNILFGKEAHMVILNDFLKENIVTVTKFLSEINVRTICCLGTQSHIDPLHRNTSLRVLKTRRMSGSNGPTMRPTRSFCIAFSRSMPTRSERSCSAPPRCPRRR